MRLADKLREIARRVQRLDPPNRLHPDKFTEEKSEIANDLQLLAKEVNS